MHDENNNNLSDATSVTHATQYVKVIHKSSCFFFNLEIENHIFYKYNRFQVKQNFTKSSANQDKTLKNYISLCIDNVEIYRSHKC